MTIDFNSAQFGLFPRLGKLGAILNSHNTHVLTALPNAVADAIMRLAAPNGAVTAITQANPAVVTSAAHGRRTGESVRIAGVIGMTEVNGTETTITVVDANSFSLDGVDSSAYTAYTSGGYWVKIRDLEELNIAEDLAAAAETHKEIPPLISLLRDKFEQTLIEMVDSDNALPQKDVDSAMIELDRQMRANSETVNAAVPSVVITAGGSNTGTGTAIVAVRDGRGRYTENALAEDLEAECDSVATAGGENFNVLGERELASDKLHPSFPSGSGSSNDATVRNPSSAANNELSNGDFETFTVADTPDNWTIDTGAAGTTIFENAVDKYRGSKALEFRGDAGGTLIAISQALTPGDYTAHKLYPFHVRLQRSAGLVAGTMQVDLYNGSSVVQDEEGNEQKLSIDLTALSDSAFSAHTESFRLPSPIPSTLTLRIHITVALTNTEKVFIDDALFSSTEMKTLYTGGPSVAFVRGDTDFALEDRFTLAISKTTGSFQELFDRMLDTPGFPLPSDDAGAETILDSLIG